MRIISILLFIFVSICPALFSTDANAKTGCFRWAFVEYKDSENVLPARVSEAGEYVFDLNTRFFFQPIKNSYLYMFTIDSASNVRVIFPDSLSKYGRSYDTFKFLIPEENKTWETDDLQKQVQIEILVSMERLKDLEGLINVYMKCETSDRAKLPECEKKILVEIRWLKSEILLRSNNNEKLIQLAGVFRGNDASGDLRIKEIEFSGLYAKTFFFRK